MLMRIFTIIFTGFAFVGMAPAFAADHVQEATLTSFELSPFVDLWGTKRIRGGMVRLNHTQHTIEITLNPAPPICPPGHKCPKVMPRPIVLSYQMVLQGGEYQRVGNCGVVATLGRGPRGQKLLIEDWRDFERFCRAFRAIDFRTRIQHTMPVTVEKQRDVVESLLEGSALTDVGNYIP